MNDIDDLPVPCAEAMLAGTLALMTAWAVPCPNPAYDAQAQRSLIARKVVSNLFFLQHHPALSAGLRQVAANAHQRWQGVAAPNLQTPDLNLARHADVLH